MDPLAQFTRVIAPASSALNASNTSFINYITQDNFVYPATLATLVALSAVQFIDNLYARLTLIILILGLSILTVIAFFAKVFSTIQIPITQNILLYTSFFVSNGIFLTSLYLLLGEFITSKIIVFPNWQSRTIDSFMFAISSLLGTEPGVKLTTDSRIGGLFFIITVILSIVFRALVIGKVVSLTSAAPQHTT